MRRCSNCCAATNRLAVPKKSGNADPFDSQVVGSRREDYLLCQIGARIKTTEIVSAASPNHASANKVEGARDVAYGQPVKRAPRP